ncbi:RDD family protein [Isoptericola croceus]|uniref:RDD family protein n=1 Tax=Isoptericola croceus TaxID=3031406 RepID=UPI0023F9E4CA|nr:RDD family protein [Isoptericola croceus]
MSDVVCAGCGSTQRAGAPFCAVCGGEFPRTGRPVEVSPEGPRGTIQRSYGGGDPGAPVSMDTGTTEPEMMTATQVPSAWQPASTAAARPPSYAHVGRRFVAHLIDGAVAGLLFGVAYGLGFMLVDLPAGVYSPGDPEFAAVLGQILTVLGVALALPLAYGLFLLIWEGRTGKTLGHLLLGMRVQSADGGMPIGVGRAFLRYLVVAAGSLLVGIGQYVVLLSPLWDAGGRKQGWHDKAAKAVVVDVRAKASAQPAEHPAAVASAGPASVAPYPSSLAVPASSPSGAPASPAPVPPTADGYPAAAAPDPYQAPAYSPTPTPDPALAPGASGDGLITGVPGVGSESPAAPPSAPAPAPAPAPEPAPAAAPAPAPAVQPAPSQDVPEEHTSFEATRMQAPVQHHALAPAPVAAVELELESGDRQTVVGLARIGRNPEASAGEDVLLVRVDDPTRSVSKNHADLGVDSAGLWLTDRGSTNGTVISAAGLPPRVAEPGARVRVPVGSTIHVGDRRIVVHLVRGA